MSHHASHSSDRNAKNPLEWVVFGISCLLVFGALGFLLLTAVTRKDGPADLRIAVGEISTRGDSTHVQIILTNEGTKTAAAVKVHLTATYGTEERESDVDVDFVPRGGKREAIAVFSGTETPGKITPKVVGYVEP